jgi:hypothetical protein
MVRLIAFLLACPSLTLPAFCDEGYHHDDLTSLELRAVHFPIIPFSSRQADKAAAYFRQLVKLFAGNNSSRPELVCA